jgi:hypothetical protein
MDKPKEQDQHALQTHYERAELLNGRLAMLGIVAALGAYAVTKQIIPGFF